MCVCASRSASGEEEMEERQQKGEWWLQGKEVKSTRRSGRDDAEDGRARVHRRIWAWSLGQQGFCDG